MHIFEREREREMDITVTSWVLGALPLVLCLILWWYDIWYVIKVRARCMVTGTKLPPGYMGIPFIGELPIFLWYFKYIGRPDDYITAKRRRYGDGVGLYRTHLFGLPSIIASSPEANKFIFQNDDKFPYRWPTNALVGADSLISNHGEEHARLRRFVSGGVNQPKPLRKIALLVQPRIVSSLHSWADKGTVFAYQEAKKITFESIGMYFASIEPGPILDELSYLFDGMVDGMRAQPLKIPGTTYYHALQCRTKLVAIFTDLVERRKQKNKNEGQAQNDLLDGLMQFQDEEGKSLTDQEIIDNITSLVVGGFESTALSLTWAIYYLAKYPDVLRKVREENLAFRKKNGGEFVQRDDVSQLTYTNKVAEEVIRLANVSGFIFRSGDEDVIYKGYLIPKGWKVICWIRYAHSDPRYFEDPLTFNPDRWDLSAKPAGYFAFAAGTRSCIGNSLVRMQIALFVHHLSIGYKWELVNPDAKVSYLPNPKPADGLEIRISKI